MIRAAALLALLALLLPAAAAAQTTLDGEPVGPVFRRQIAELDRSATPVAWSLQLRREGSAWIAAGGGTIAVTLIVGAADLLSRGGSAGAASPYIAGFGVPLGMSLIVQGLPAMLGSSRYLHHLVDNGLPRTSLGRLRLIHTWELDLLRLRRDSLLLGSAFLGAVTIVSGIVWALRDRVGVNGPPGTAGYDLADAFTMLAFWGSSGATGITALLAHLDLHREARTEHRLYTRVSASAGPTWSDGRVGLQGAVTIRF